MEPMAASGERLTAGLLVEGENRELVTAELLPISRLRRMYGREFGDRIADALETCIHYAEKFYKVNPLSIVWSPPLEGFFLGGIQSSVAESLEDCLNQAALQCSSFSASARAGNLQAVRSTRVSAPELWRKRVTEAVTVQHAEYASYFGKSIALGGSSVPLKLGFLSEKYAAQFDVVGGSKNVKRGLARVQSKLWQLDRLRDEETLLFRPEVCELLLEYPATEDSRETKAVDDFLEELRREASRRNINLYATGSPTDAARHLIDQAA
ncbi:MAG: hypothetical protein OXE40_13435 [Gammaproteobacteria bacterium]|nr:hypothetical protein [Gammaproteobacteria bacterium]